MNEATLKAAEAAGAAVHKHGTSATIFHDDAQLEAFVKAVQPPVRPYTPLTSGWPGPDKLQKAGA